MAVDDEVLAALDSMSLAELRYRAEVVTALSWTENASNAHPSTSYRVDGATRYATNDSGGQSAIWYFTDDDRALLITFQHDCALNFAGPTCGAELQEIFYQGVPEDLQRLAADRTPAYENLLAENPETGEPRLLATAVAWFDGTRWQATDGPENYCEAEGIDPAEAGLGTLEPYLLGQAFTPEAYVDENLWYDGRPGPDRDALIAEASAVFAQHQPPK